MNFAKKQSDNLEQQETELPSALQSPLGRLLSLFRRRPASTELRALMADEPEDLDTEDEGLISFEEERVRAWPGTEGPRCSGQAAPGGVAAGRADRPPQTLETGRGGLEGPRPWQAGPGHQRSRGRTPWARAAGAAWGGESTRSPGPWGRALLGAGSRPARTCPSAVRQAQLSFNTDTLC